MNSGGPTASAGWLNFGKGRLSRSREKLLPDGIDYVPSSHFMPTPKDVREGTNVRRKRSGTIHRSRCSALRIPVILRRQQYSSERLVENEIRQWDVHIIDKK
jgi:hypothetical protein